MKKYLNLIDLFLNEEIDYDKFYSQFNDLYFGEKYEEENKKLSTQETDFLDEINEQMFYAAKDPDKEERKYGYIDDSQFRDWLGNELAEFIKTNPGPN